MLSAQEREELERMRDNLAARIDYYEDQVSYGNFSLEDKERALSTEFGPDYRETLASMNCLIHKQPLRHRVHPRTPVTVFALLVVAVLGVSLFVSALYPSVNAQTIRTDLVLSEDQPLRLAWDAPRELYSLTALPIGVSNATLVVQDAQQETILAHVQDESLTCIACPITLHPPVLLELRGEGSVRITQLSTRQKS